jgi:hypothetical protein
MINGPLGNNETTRHPLRTDNPLFSKVSPALFPGFRIRAEAGRILGSALQNPLKNIRFKTRTLDLWGKVSSLPAVLKWSTRLGP